MNLLQWERAVAVATMTARERLAPGGGSALMRASGRHPGGRVAGGEGLLAGLIHDVPLVLARHFVGNLRSLLRSEGGRVGKEWVRTWWCGWSPGNEKKKRKIK